MAPAEDIDLARPKTLTINGQAKAFAAADRLGLTLLSHTDLPWPCGALGPGFAAFNPRLGGDPWEALARAWLLQERENAHAGRIAALAEWLRAGNDPI